MNIESIYTDLKAHAIICYSIEENGVAVSLDGHYLNNDDLICERIAILKPDAFYNTKNMATPPMSPDNFVVAATDDGVCFYGVELKSGQRPGIRRVDIENKFNTLFNEFLRKDFAHLFPECNVPLRRIFLWVVCDPLKVSRKRCSDAGYEKLLNRTRGLLAEMSNSYPAYSFAGVTAQVKAVLCPPKIVPDGYLDAMGTFCTA